MMKKSIKSTKPGFTFIELILAITIMGIMFSLTLTVMVGMLRFYVFSSNIRQNQENGRNILDTIVRDIKYGTLLTPSGYGTSNSVCIKKSDNTLTKYYQKDLAIWRSVYTFDSTISPTGCPDNDDSLPSNISIKSRGSQISLDRMRVYPGSFSFTRAEGSVPASYQNITSVVINFKFFTGNPVEIDSLVRCLSNDIYCSSLQFNTAVSIRNNSQ
jgi:prepilin-type N-terminal cleavage/methylation domain-containing protein